MPHASRLPRHVLVGVLILLLLSALPVVAQPTLVNPGFEANGGTFTVAQGWSAFGVGKWESSLVANRGWVQGMSDFPASGSLGVYQRLEGAVPGTTYRLTAATHSQHAVLDGAVGIDPAGGVNPTGATWGSGSNQSDWTQVTVEVTATGTAITVFLRARSSDAFQMRFQAVMFDDATLTPLAPTATATPTFTHTPSFTPGGPTATPTQTSAENPTPFQPDGPVWGLVMVLGESIQSPGYQHDDMGPPLERVIEVYRESPATCLFVGGASWRRAEASDPGAGPSTYDWRLLEASVDPFVPLLEGRLGITYASFSAPAWLQGQENTPRYWELAERYMEAFARQMNRRGIYHFIFENEPNLLARSDWADYYMGRLPHAYAAIKRADPRNVVIGGNLAERAAVAGHFNQLFDRGLGQHCDVIGHHPYTDNPNTAVDMDDIKLLRQQMVQRGLGHMKIFLGEGWGPKRELSNIKRGNPADRPYRHEIDALLAFMINGHQRLSTPTHDYDPNWLLGATFFTFNDNLCCRHWPARATPIPGGCLIDGYPMIPCNLDPGHFNGGLIDFHGNAKRDLIWRFPDYAWRATPTPRPNPDALGPNLLVNGTFEGGFNQGVANGWQRYDTTETGKWETRPGRTGGSAQAFGETSVGFNGGIRQAFDTVPGQWYGIRAWVAYETNSVGPGIFMAAGWDTTGQMDSPRAYSMVWSIDYTEDLTYPPREWKRFEHQFLATGERSSLWFWGGTEWAPPSFFMWVDDVEVYPIDNPIATATPTPGAGLLNLY